VRTVEMKASGSSPLPAKQSELANGNARVERCIAEQVAMNVISKDVLSKGGLHTKAARANVLRG